jgi:hypothetical protein
MTREQQEQRAREIADRAYGRLSLNYDRYVDATTAYILSLCADVEEEAKRESAAEFGCVGWEPKEETDV